MKIALRDGDLILREISTDQYNIIKSWNLMRWVKAQQCLQGRASIGLLDKLTVFGKLPPNIEAYRQSLHKTGLYCRRCDSFFAYQKPKEEVERFLETGVFDTEDST